MKTALLLGSSIVLVTACGMFGADKDAPPLAPAQPDADEGADGSAQVGNVVGADEGFKLDPLPSTVTVMQGGKAKVSVIVRRGKHMREPIEVKVTGLRDGTTATPITLAGDTGEIEIAVPVSAPQGAAPGVVEARAGTLTQTTPLDVFVRGTPGAMDTTWGSAGQVLSVFGAKGYARISDLVVAPDDSLYLLASIQDPNLPARVAHLGADGKLDPAYGDAATPGIATIEIFSPNALALQADGQLLVVGGSPVAPPRIGRLTKSGQPDGTFGSGAVPGVQTLGTGTLSGSNEGAYAVTTRNNGDIYVAWDNRDGAVIKTGTMRLSQNGSPKTEFGAEGAARSFAGRTLGIAVRPTGAPPALAVVSANADGNLAFIQSNSDTSGVDVTFGSAPKLIGLVGVHRRSDVAPGIVQLADGNIISAVRGTSDLYLKKFTPAGDGAAGFALSGLAGPFSAPGDVTGLAVQTDGKILVALRRDGAFDAMRFLSNGDVDMEFGQEAHITTTIGIASYVHKVALQKSGRIILAGYAHVGDPDAALVAFWP